MTKDIRKVSLIDSIERALSKPFKHINVLDDNLVSFDFLVKLQYQLRTLLKENGLEEIKVILDTSKSVYSITQPESAKNKLILLYVPQKGDMQ